MEHTGRARDVLRVGHQYVDALPLDATEFVARLCMEDAGRRGGCPNVRGLFHFGTGRVERFTEFVGRQRALVGVVVEHHDARAFRPLEGIVGARNAVFRLAVLLMLLHRHDAFGGGAFGRAVDKAIGRVHRAQRVEETLGIAGHTLDRCGGQALRGGRFFELAVSRQAQLLCDRFRGGQFGEAEQRFLANACVRFLRRRVRHWRPPRQATGQRSSGCSPNPAVRWRTSRCCWRTVCGERETGRSFRGAKRCCGSGR